RAHRRVACRRPSGGRRCGAGGVAAQRRRRGVRRGDRAVVRGGDGTGAWGGRDRGGPRGSGPVTPRRRRLVLPDHPDHYALHDDIALVHPQRAHGGVRGLESDPAARLAVEPFHRGAGAVHERHHGLAIVGLVTFVHDDEIAVLDVLVDHRLAADLEHVAAAAARNELVGHGDRFVPAHGLNGLARRYEPEQRQLGGAGLPLGRHDFYGPALVVGAADVAFALEVGEMLVHGGQGLTG